jgi:hypothetical protein
MLRMAGENPGLEGQFQGSRGGCSTDVGIYWWKQPGRYRSLLAPSTTEHLPSTKHQEIIHHRCCNWCASGTRPFSSHAETSISGS